jgi:hypothetical protein
MRRSGAATPARRPVVRDLQSLDTPATGRGSGTSPPSRRRVDNPRHQRIGQRGGTADHCCRSSQSHRGVRRLGGNTPGDLLQLDPDLLPATNSTTDRLGLSLSLQAGPDGPDAPPTGTDPGSSAGAPRPGPPEAPVGWRGGPSDFSRRRTGAKGACSADSVSRRIKAPRTRGAPVPARRHALDLRPAARAGRPHHVAGCF